MTLDFSISQPLENPTLRVLSFGAGVQSTVMLLRSLRGDFGARPDAVIFADTVFEPLSVYANLKWVEGEVARQTNGQTSFSVVSAGNIRADHEAGINTTGQRFASMPFHTSGGGMARRQCTMEYKIDPVTKEIRRLLGVGKGKRVPNGVTVEQWIGISTDELERLKISRKKWIKNRWPLIEARLSRNDCRAWFDREYPGRSIMKSACSGCPYRSNAMWRNLRDFHPEDFEEACKFDEAIRGGSSSVSKMRQEQFVHRSGRPLRVADLEDNALGDLFDGECDGVCGT